MCSRRWVIGLGLIAGAVSAAAVQAGLRDGAPVILNEYNAVRSDRWLDCDGLLCPDCGGPPCKEDVFFGRVVGNGGNWFELIVVQDHLDMRNWQLTWTEQTTTPTAGTITLTDHSLWSDLRAGTIITFTESDAAHGGRDTDTTFNPAIGDWWININTLTGDPDDPLTRTPQTTYASTTTDESGDGPGNFSVGNDNWQLTVWDASPTAVFGPCGEGTTIHEANVSTREVFKLEEDPNAQISPAASAYYDGTSSSFGHPNVWSDGDKTQDFSLLRAAGTTIALIAVPTFDMASWGETHAGFPNLDEVETLPASMTTFTAGQTFYVEVWAQTLHPTGLAMVSLDVDFDAGLLEVLGGTGFPIPVNGIFRTTLFNSLTAGTVDNTAGRITDLSGSYLPAGGCTSDPTGVQPRWSRVAVVQMQATAPGPPFILAGPTGSPIYVVAHCGTSEIDPEYIVYQGINEPGGSLVLRVPEAPVTVMQGDTVVVDRVAEGLTAAIDGVHALLHYNTNNLWLQSVDPVSPWAEVSETDIDGDVAYAVQIEGGSQGPGDGPFPVATLTFVALDAGSSPKVSFRADNIDPYPLDTTHLTDAATGLPVYPTKVGTVDGNIVIVACDDDNACTSNGFDEGTRECVYPPLEAGTPCGGAPAGACDAQDTCDGAGSCVANYLPNTTECRAPAGVCDLADYCTGLDADCPTDVKSTAECRAESGPCDVAEFCDGVSDDCPADTFDPSGDLDGDGDVDLDDYAGLEDCLGGPDVAYSQPECRCGDMDRDSDVDLADFAAWTEPE